MIKHFIVEEEGQTLVEYGLLISLVALVIVTVLTFMGSKLRAGYSAVANGIQTTT